MERGLVGKGENSIMSSLDEPPLMLWLLKVYREDADRASQQVGGQYSESS